MTTPVPASPSSVKHRWRRVLRLPAILAIVVFGALVAERWRGHHALRSWLEQRTEQGESLNPTVLWPKPDERARKFQSDLSEATRQLPAELVTYSGRTSGMVPDQPGRARRGSQEPRPLDHPTNTWAQLEAAVRNSAGPLQRLRQLLRDLPSSMAGDIVHRLETDDLPSFGGARVSAQTLHDVAICELHQGNRENALENLQALLSLVHLYTDEPTLVNYMIRVAILGLSVDACWDALQAPGWTEEQLAQLQQAAQIPPLLTQMPQVVQAERAARLVSWESFRSHSYNAWLLRYEEVYKGFGLKSPEWQTTPVLLQWRHCGFHPVWRFAWADQEELHYLEHSQNEFAAVAEAAKLRSWRFLEERLNTIQRDYRPPAASWRFHGRLPFLDDVSMLFGSSRPKEPAYSYPNYKRAWQVTFENLTLHQLVVTAIALKRHELRHSKLPVTLNALVPDFLPAAPRDFMDGQSLRYRLNPNTTFQLYSVGADAQDDGGDPVPDPAQRGNRTEQWPGRDWVWPQLAPATPPPKA